MNLIFTTLMNEIESKIHLQIFISVYLIFGTVARVKNSLDGKGYTYFLCCFWATVLKIFGKFGK